jgi:nitroreductase
MADLDILRKIPDTGYREPEPEIDANALYQTIHSRRSVRVYDTNIRIPDSVVERCLDAALAAPNSSNLQPWEFFWIKSDQALSEVKKICLSQSAAVTSNTLIAVVAKMNTWDQRRQQMIEYFDQQEKTPPRGAYLYYRKVVRLAYYLGFMNWFGFVKKVLNFSGRFSKKPSPQPATGFQDLRVWAHKSTALACENLMLPFRAEGYDTCPMEGFDGNKLARFLKLDKKSEVCMVISAGKRAPNGIFAPRVRFPKEQFIKQV